MRYLRVLALVGICLFSASFAHAQGFSFGFGVGPSYVGPAPECVYGYYDYYPYACAPYGYYGPEWFSDGFFIGAGPWFRGGYYGWRGYRGDFGDREGGFRRGFDDRGRGYYGRRDFEDRGRGYYGRGDFRGGYGREGYGERGYRAGDGRGNYRGGFRGGESHGGGGFRGGESHGGSGFRGGGGAHGEGGSHGGGHR